MKPSQIPIVCGTALALMAGAAGSHWFSVREMVALVAVLPADLVAPVVNSQPVPSPVPDDGVAREARDFLAEARRETEAPSRPTTGANAAHDTDSRVEKLLTLLESTVEQNQELRDLIGGTNRDLQELRFQVDSYDGQFRPLKVEQEPVMYDDGSAGVLPPLDPP